MLIGINIEFANNSSQAPTVRNFVEDSGQWIRQMQSPVKSSGGTVSGKVR